MDRMIKKYGGAEVLRRAVSGMLPKNKLRDIRLARLRGPLPSPLPMLTLIDLVAKFSLVSSFRGVWPSIQEKLGQAASPADRSTTYKRITIENPSP